MMKGLAWMAILSFLFLLSAFLNALQYEECNIGYSFVVEKVKTKLYDFSNNASIDRWAYRYDARRLPPSQPNIPDIEFNSLQYYNISYRDAIYQIDVADNVRHAAHRFVFTIYENRSNISSINIFWQGAGLYLFFWNGNYYIVPSGSGARLYAWNYSSSVYDEILNIATYNITNATVNISTDYIGNEIILLVEQNSATFIFGPFRFYSVIMTDYISVEVKLA